jgi:hypothetical protein
VIANIQESSMTAPSSMHRRRPVSPAWSAVLIAGALIAACSSSPDAPGGASGGATGTGGAAATGGRGGSGGAPGTGGQPAGGSPGAGGTGGNGGAATGGSPATGGGPATGDGGAATGGAPGSGGQGGGTDAANDKSADVTPPGDSSPGDGGSMTGPSLDACFAGLRTLSRDSQIATKRSADGKIEARIALEVDGFGTSGTKAWRLIRIAIVTPDAQVCVKDEEALRAAYKGSHHNCTDVLTVTASGHTYEFKGPDTDPKRGDTTLTIITGGTPGTATKLTTSACKAGSPSDACISGGPC